MDSEPLTLTDEELARQTQAGSLAAFEGLVHRYGPRIYGFIAQTSRNGNDAADITQDTFVRAFRGISRYDPSREFAPWLFTLARHATIDYFRRKPSVAEEPLPEKIDYNDPSELVARREDSLQLWRLARDHLPEIQFQALWLHYAEDMRVAQVARVLRKTRIHIKVLLYRARRALAQELSAEHENKKSRKTSTSRPRSEAVSPAA